MTLSIIEIENVTADLEIEITQNEAERSILVKILNTVFLYYPEEEN